MELFLCFLVAVNFEFFYLLPPIAGPDNYKLLLLPMMLVLFFESFITGNLLLGRYGWWVLCFMAISVFGVMVAWSSGQGISLGIKAAKFIPLAMVYFLLAGRKMDAQKFSTYFIVMSLAVASLATISSVTRGAINFFPGLPGELVEQSGRLRVTAGQFVISAAAVIGFARYRQSLRFWPLLASAALLGEVIFVQQTRGFIIAIFLSMFVVFIMSRELTMPRVSMYLLFTGFCLASWMMIPSVDFSSIGFVKRTQADMMRRSGSFGGSLQARLNAYDYYWKELQKKAITGRGILNFNWKDNPDKRLQQNYGIHLSDIGVMDFLIQTGLIGAVWLAYGLLRLWKDILLYRKHLAVACYFIIGTFTMPTIDMFFRYDSLFLFAVFLGLSSSVIMSAKTDAFTQGPDPWMFQLS
ncbi:MAG: hypothetical protein HY887_01150 [Deltaproteobacteria bacterium]|nr:hypothetical protein [Deltaproteobacteria bacterium]